MKTLLEWQSEVSSIRSYLDENYDCSVWGIGTVQNFKGFQLPWGNSIIEKFTDRTIPLISGGLLTRAFAADVEAWIKQAVEFGNASIIIYDDGNIRIPSPLNSLAQKTAFGNVIFTEIRADGSILWAWDEQLKLKFVPVGEIEPVERVVEGAQIFTLFYQDGNLTPYGQSRISRSIRLQTTWASRILAYTESVGFNQGHTQLIFTNMNQEIMQEHAAGNTEAVEALKEIQVGVHKALMLGNNEENNSPAGVTTVAPTDPSGLIKVFERIAATVSSSRNMEPRELGNITAVAPSAEAQYAQNEDLALEIKKFTRKIHRTVLAAVMAVATVNDERTPELMWANPATPSEASMMDAYSKLVAANPAARYSRVAMIKYGIDPEIVEDIMGESNSMVNAFEEAQNAEPQTEI